MSFKINDKRYFPIKLERNKGEPKAIIWYFRIH